MFSLNLSTLLLAIILSTYCVAIQDTISSDLVNKQVDITVDLTTHLPKITSSVTLENTGKSAVKSFVYAVVPALSDRVSYLGATIKSGESTKTLKVAETTVSGQKDKKLYRIDLSSPLEAGKTVVVDVESSYSHSLTPYPSQIQQSEKQFVKFTGNAYFYSPYKTTKQTTTVNCASSTIESFTKVKPAVSADTAITYGPYENIDPFTDSEVVIHYENNTPFLAVTSLTRVIEVSHWGNIAVEETYDIRHTGAVLKGPFSRYDYQRNQDGFSSIKSFKTQLPASAADVYYRDEIGNISTSNLKELDDMVELELRPRFPLFGGWKTHYYIGYNVPTYQYLYNEDDRYALKIAFVDHVFDDQVIDQMTLKIILPEGAGNIKLDTPFEVARGSDELHFTYLDTTGRPVITATKTNLVEQHMQDIKLSYTFQKVRLLQEPLLLVGALYLLFVLAILYVRMDFSITKDEASESRMRIASLIEQIQATQDKRSALYQSYDDAINKSKASKDVNRLTASRKKIDGDYKQLTQQINGLLAKLKTEGSDAADKVSELQKLDSNVREQINLAISYAEKLITGKLNKQQYVDTESAVRTKREEFYNKMEAILTSI